MNSSRFSYFLSICISVILHTVLLVAITYGWNAGQSAPKKMRPRFVEAKLVQLKPKTEQKKASPPKVKKIDLTKQRREQERKLAEQKRRKQQAAKRAAQAKKEKQRKEAQRRREKEKARQAELERQRRIEEQRRQEELERQQEQRRREEMEEQFAKELEAEDAQLQEQDYATTAQSYVALIAARIESNWSRPPSARKGMQCELSLRLVPTGQVIDVSITKSSGNPAFDRSAVLAVQKVERFAELQKVPPEVFERYFRVVQLVFSPEDLRQ